MHKITQIKKLKTIYQVTLNNQEVIEVEPVIYLKLHLKLFQELDQSAYQRFILDNQYEKYKRIGLKRLNNMQTKKEMYDYLIKKEATVAIAKQIVFEFAEKKYLDDYLYTKMYVSLKQYQKGPKYIQDELLKKGVDLNIILGFTERINEIEILSDLIPKKMRTLNGKKAKKQILLKIKTDFYRLGFSQDAIDTVIGKHNHLLNEVDVHVIEKEVRQQRLKIKSKILSYEDKQKIISKLYRKGYPLDMITKALSDIK